MGPLDGPPVVLRPHPGRRRDQPQLSCNSCRQRKRKCDRQKPCSHCIRRHLESTCVYADFITPPSPSGPSRAISPAARHFFKGSSASPSELGGLPTPSSSASAPSPEAANLKLSKSGTGFKDSTHWTSVLSGVTEAEGHDDTPGEVHSHTVFDDGSLPPDYRVLLFGGCKQVADPELFDCLPSRRECDGMIAFYFRAQEYRSVIHPTEFLKRYNAFWENPRAASVSWLGLLYSIFCLTTRAQCQESSLNADNNAPSAWPPTVLCKVLAYRERVVQCLVRGQFAKGGPDIVETLVHYILIESYLNRDTNVELWLLMSNVLQIAIRMGYHRDPQHFKSLSPYQGEMRRRMWATLCSMDLGFSTQMGLPSSIKHSLSDTMPPRNLQDRDFDASSADLPPARPIDELTSSTVILAKHHIATNMVTVSDMVCSPHPLSYDDLVAANSKLDITYVTMPDSCKLRPLSESLLDPPSVVFQRINFYMHYQRARILVNWKFLTTSRDASRSSQCWSIVIEAALKILQLQHLMAEESEAEVSDSFRPAGMVDSCFINNGYFLAASIACFLVQHHQDRLSAQDLSEVRSLLEKSLAIWSCTGDLSREATKVVAALRVVLGKPQDPSLHPAIEGKALPQLEEDPFDRNQMAFSNFSSFFDDLPLIMMDIEDAAFPPVASIPTIDYWAQADKAV